MQEETFCNFHAISEFPAVQQRCLSQWPLLCSHSSSTNCIPRSLKTKRTETAGKLYIHCTISADYWASKRYINTKKICRQSITHFDVDLSSIKSEQLWYFSSAQHMGDLTEHLAEYRSVTNDTASGDFTIYLRLEEAEGCLSLA